LAHLFALNIKPYKLISAQVVEASSPLDPKARAKLLLEERGMAHYIFTVYEETYYLWEHAIQFGSKDRAALLLSDLEYFSRHLCNPRLLWYWDEGKLGLAFAEKLHDHYNNNILINCIGEMRDPDGPFKEPVKHLE